MEDEIKLMLNPVCLECKQDFQEQYGNSLVIFKCNCGKDVVLNIKQKKIFDELLYGFSKTLYLNGLIKNFKYEVILEELKEEWGDIQEINRWDRQEQLKKIFDKLKGELK